MSSPAFLHTPSATRRGALWCATLSLVWSMVWGNVQVAGAAEVADAAPLSSPMCPPAFHARESGRVLEAHATACADWQSAPTAPPGADNTDGAAAPSTDNSASSGYADPAPSPGSVSGVSNAARRSWQDTAVGASSDWRQLPAFKVVALMKFQGGGLILTDSGSQYFLKLRGVKGVRMGVKVAF
jgi:hypothetical protein